MKKIAAVLFASLLFCAQVYAGTFPSMTTGGAVVSSSTATYVAYYSTATTLTGSSKLTFDSSSGVLTATGGFVGGSSDTPYIDFVTNGSDSKARLGINGDAGSDNDDLICLYPGNNFSGTAMFCVDIATGNISFPTNAATLKLPLKSTAGDPTGANGMFYYNSSSNKFRAYENGAWANAIGLSIGGSNTQLQYNNSGALGGVSGATSNGTTLTLTSPKVVTDISDTNGNELFKVTATGSAVNEFTVANAAASSGPTLSTTGSDSNINMNVTPKGTGSVVVSSSSTSPSSFSNGLQTNGHIEGTGSAPTLSSCGTGPSITGNDNAFTVTAGTTASGCTITFATAWTNAPHCTVTQRVLGLVNALTYAVTTTAVTLTQTSADGKVYDGVCVGNA